MKMYILVKETIPVGFVIVAVAHASLAAYLYSKRPCCTNWSLLSWPL